MVIYEDTRQQAGKHDLKHRWWMEHGIVVMRKKLDFGDYARDGSNIAIDTKKGVAEISGNVGREHARFVREINRAQAQGHRIIFLVEDAEIGSVSTVSTWINNTCRRCAYFKFDHCDSISTKCVKYKHRPMTGTTIQKILESMQLSHGCTFEFCKPEDSARRICELLGVSINA